MKKLFNYSVFALILLLSSCEKGLDEINQNTITPTATDIDPVFQLNNAVMNSSFPSGSIVYEMGIVQQLISPNGGVLAGANFNQDNRNVIAPLWPAYYRNVIRNTKDVIYRTKDVAEKSNLMNMARIFQAYAFMVLTDTYGDIPYSEAGLGYLEEKVLPKYDPQQAIYADIIKELTEATAALNATGKIETGDVLYGGNIDKWKKFGFSLLLRAGMRLSKVDPAKAQQTVQAAFAGGVITNNADNAVFKHDANYPNPIGNTLNGTEAANFYLAKPFVDQLKSTNDPRLAAIAVRYVGATSGVKQTADVGTTDPGKQIGIPIGKDNATIIAAATADGLASFYEYSQLDRARMANRIAPAYFVTAAQTQLLLAEAVQRGWITTGTAQDYYNAGVRAHMEQLAGYSAASAISPSAIQAYLDANPYNPTTALQQINTQYWIASFLNGPEAWANFRRSGYPTLAPNPFAGDIPAGTFIKRLTYPTTEISANTTNVNEAISRQGADRLETKVWWDK